jgi:hypothetical protein
MAHWAEIDENNIVIRVVVTDNNDSNGDEGYQWLIDNLGGRWIQTSYNTRGGIHYLPDDQRDENGHKIPSGKPHLRYNFAGIGFYYDEVKDAFIPPKPVDLAGKWIFNDDTCLWELKSVKSP